MTRIFLEALEFYAFHGVPPEERVVGHRYHVNVSLLADELAHETDRVEDTIDYGDVGQTIQHVAQSQQFLTLEKLGRVICQTLLMRYPKVRRVDLTLSKRLPPADMIADRAGVEMSLERSR